MPWGSAAEVVQVKEEAPEFIIPTVEQMRREIGGSVGRARNWGLVCGFGYGFAAATFAFMILLFVTAPHS